MEAYRAVVDKRDQRVYLPAPIPDEALRQILQAARMTGSSKNREPNRLIVVTEREGVRALGALSEGGKWLAHAAAVVVITQVEPHEFDAGRCAQNMMVAAWAEGIASCPAHLPEPAVARLLGIPKDVHVNRVIGFGYADPTRSPSPKSVARRRKPLEELVHRERW